MDEASRRRKPTPGMALVLAAALALLAAPAPALAQAPAPPEPKTFTASAEIQALIANARANHKPGTPTMVQRILTLPPYAASLEHRTGVGPAAGVARYPGVAVLADWNALATPHPEWFTADQVHLNPTGAAALAGLITRSA